MIMNKCTKEEFLADEDTQMLVDRLTSIDKSTYMGWNLIADFLYRNIQVCKLNPDELFKELGIDYVRSDK